MEIDGINYEWEDIPDKGKCLVPKNHVTADDVRSCKFFFDDHGEEHRFVRIYTPIESGPFYGVYVVKDGYCYSDLVFKTPEELAKCMQSSSGVGSFARWKPDNT
jgi:hypothetical protein